MEMTWEEIDIEHTKITIKNVAYVVTAAVAAWILIQALFLKTINMSLMTAVTVLLQLF
jgi:hypothetical protein